MGFLSKMLGIDLEAETPVPAVPAPDDRPAIPEDADFETRVEMALERIRPALRADGGDVQLVEIIGHSVRVKLVGACEGCASSALTLRHGIERALRDTVPDFEDLIPF